MINYHENGTTDYMIYLSLCKVLFGAFILFLPDV